MNELEEALWNTPIKSVRVIQKYIRDNFVSKEDLKTYVLQKARCNIHFEADKRILELSKRGLMDFFNAKDVIITK